MVLKWQIASSIDNEGIAEMSKSLSPYACAAKSLVSANSKIGGATDETNEISTHSKRNGPQNIRFDASTIKNTCNTNVKQQLSLCNGFSKRYVSQLCSQQFQRSPEIALRWPSVARYELKLAPRTFRVLPRDAQDSPEVDQERGRESGVMHECVYVWQDGRGLGGRKTER